MPDNWRPGGCWPRSACAISCAAIRLATPRWSWPTATVTEVATALCGGQLVAVFPEGTTWCGQAGGRFRPAMFQAAIDARAPVVPVSLRYRAADGNATTVAAFLGEDTLVASLLRIVSVRGVRVSARLHPALYPGPGASRRLLARAADASVKFSAGRNRRGPSVWPCPVGWWSLDTSAAATMPKPP